MLSKDSLRKTVLNRRSNINENEYRKVSRLICVQLINFTDWKNVSSVLVYSPITKSSEVDISNFTDYLMKFSGNLQIFTPNFNQKNPVFFKFKSLKNGRIVSDVNFEFIIVPALAVDKQKYRLGYGGGYYDRLLSKHPKAKTIVPIYSQDIFGTLPHEVHDRKVNIVITEKV